MTPKNQRFMQLTMSPIEYVMIDEYDGDSYWGNIPTYIISRCPLCGAPYSGQLDVHSLHGWSTFDWVEGTWFFDDKWEQVGCKHRLAVQKFVNLEGHIPSELRGYEAELHVPFIMPFLVTDGIAASQGFERFFWRF